MSLTAFLDQLFAGRDGFLDLRALGNGQPAHTLRVSLTEQPAIDQFVTEHAGRSVYFGTALRITAASGQLENCQPLRLLFTDIDFKDLPEQEARPLLAGFALTPSAVVATGGGLHVYWLLSEPVDHELAKVLLRGLAKALRADLKSAEPAHVLRLPGTLNHKYDPPRPVTIESTTAYAYSVEEFQKALGLGETLTVSRESFAQPTIRTGPVAAGGRNEYLTRVGGQLRRHGWPKSALEGALWERNLADCVPPLDRSEVRTIARSVSKYIPATDTFGCTEAGNAEFFAAIFGNEVRFDHRRGRYLLFSDHRWTPDPDGELQRLSLESIRVRQEVALKITDATERKKRLAWALQSESRHRLDSTLVLARSLRPISDAGDGWDANPWLLGTPNGIVDLATGQLRPGTPADRITCSVRVPYDANAVCPLWEQTIHEIFNGDQDLVTYIHRAFGYSLSGDCREECLFFCWGGGRNGKGTLMNTFAYVLGDYSDDLPFSALELHERSGIPNDIAKLVAKRYATASEAGEAVRLNEARVKALTGRDPITARFLHREYFTFQPDAKFWLATNTKPIIRDDSQGFWSRIHLIPFTRSFANREDKTLKDRLRAEAPGILAWAVRGCLEWQRVGLQPPDVVRAATEQYRLESDPLCEFYDTCCEIRQQARVKASELFDRYRLFASKNETRHPFGQRSFLQMVGRRFEKKLNNGTWYVGIGLRDSLHEEPMAYQQKVHFDG